MSFYIPLLKYSKIFVLYSPIPDYFIIFFLEYSYSKNEYVIKILKYLVIYEPFFFL